MDFFRDDTDFFGETDPRKVPEHLFWNALGVDYKTAIRANIAVQDYSVCPRHWYIDARFRCRACGAEFMWSANEQKTWFETYRFYVDSSPTLCRNCRAKRRDAMQLRKEYDASVGEARSGGSAEQKQSIVRIVDELESLLGKLPVKMQETRDTFRKQLAGTNDAD